MKKNDNTLCHMAMIMMILCNGLCLGTAVSDMRFMWAHGFDKLTAMDLIIQTMLVHYTYNRIKYLHNRINDNTK